MNMKEFPLVSIGIPCYNHEKFIDDCLDSVIKQSYQNIELIICDDSSSDNSWEIIKKREAELKNRFVRVCLMRNEVNLGLTKTLNRLLSECTGKYVNLLASDDMLDTGYLEKTITEMEKLQDVDVLITNGIAVDDKNNRGGIIYQKKPDLNSGDLFGRLYDQNFIFSPSALVRYDVYERFGKYDENIMIEDWEYWLRITRDEMANFSYLDECLVYYRKSTDSMTSLFNNPALEKRRQLIYNAEMQIIDKYGTYFEADYYAMKKVNYLEMSYVRACQLKLENMKKLIYNDMRTFNQWKQTKLLQRVKVRLRFLVRKLKYSFN